jgi:hypothetical protein
MFKVFNKTFLRFLLGFVVIIALSFVMIVTASAYYNQGNIGALGSVSTFYYNVFIK